MKPKFGYHYRLHDTKKIIYITPTMGTILKVTVPSMLPSVLLLGYFWVQSKKMDREFAEEMKNLSEDED